MMSWRDPRSPREFVVADCDRLRELADTYHPFIRFADAERFFPALAEAWLSHATAAPWPALRLRPGSPTPAETGVDRNRRGTGVCRANDDVTQVQVLGGTPNADDRPLQLEDRPGDPDSITSYHGVGGDHFLDFGGWVSDIAGRFQGHQGDIDYLYRAFSELAG